MTPWLQDADVTLYHGDVLATLRELPAASVDCVVTSPPYWGLRDYGTGEWEGGDPGHAHETLPARGGRGGSGSPGKQTEGAFPSEYAAPECSCGAIRIDQQLGLEPTPEQYVERMVEVFREVRRVLAAHGTVWLNLGDSYASNWPCNRRNVIGEGSLPNGKREARPPRMSDGLKEKDLVGIPWRVAFALQQPYYAGRIKSESDRRWLAAIIDAEGCIHIHRRKAGTASGSKFTRKDGTEVNYERKQDTYGVMVSIDNTSKALVDRCEEIIGQGSRYVHEKATGKQQRKQTLYRLTLTGQQSRELLREVYPYLVAKQQEARIAYASPSSGDGAAQAHEAIKLLHSGSPTTVDAQAPPSLLEAGWFLRSDVIWSKKPNPMPESVTDRPTKAHEYVFLLSKQPRYFFDQEAVREPAEWARWGNQTVPKHGGTDTGAGWIKGRPKHELQRPQARRAVELFEQAGLTDDHLDAIRSVGITDTGKATVTQNGTGRNAEDIAALAQEAKDALGGYYREFLIPNGRNIRSVWEIATQPYPEAHFATFPEELARRCIAAGCPEQVCRVCGKAREPLLERTGVVLREPAVPIRERRGDSVNDKRTALSGTQVEPATMKRVGLTDCGHSDYRPGIVLDPFIGSGTVAYVARKLGRHSIGIDLNAEYLELAARRLQQQSLFASDGVA